MRFDPREVGRSHSRGLLGTEAHGVENREGGEEAETTSSDTSFSGFAGTGKTVEWRGNIGSRGDLRTCVLERVSMLVGRI